MELMVKRHRPDFTLIRELENVAAVVDHVLKCVAKKVHSLGEVDS